MRGRRPPPGGRRRRGRSPCISLLLEIAECALEVGFQPRGRLRPAAHARSGPTARERSGSISRTRSSACNASSRRLACQRRPRLVQQPCDPPASLDALLLDAPLFFDLTEGETQFLERTRHERVRGRLERLQRLQCGEVFAFDEAPARIVDGVAETGFLPRSGDGGLDRDFESLRLGVLWVESQRLLDVTAALR